MPYLYEIDDARDERPLDPPLQETCGTCAAMDAGELLAGGRRVEIGYCRAAGMDVTKRKELPMNEKKTREEMSGMELLRRLADDVMQDVPLWVALSSASDGRWGENAGGETLAAALRGIADRIEADRASEAKARSAEDREAAERLRKLRHPDCIYVRNAAMGWEQSPPMRYSEANSAFRDRLVELLDGCPGERPVPEGVEWPRYEDGRKVAFGDRICGDESQRAVAEVCFCDSGDTALCDGGGEIIASLFPGERVLRDEATAADGKPLVEGETAYALSSGLPYSVASVEADGSVQARLDGIGCPERFAADSLTHARPEVLDVVGHPFCVGDTVYIIEDGSAREVVKIARDGMIRLSGIGWYRPCAVRVTPPASQEAIDSDALKNAGDYCKAHPEANALREDGLSCKQAQIAHLLRRQRELDANGGEAS